jgi:hypothetical protein
MAPTPRTFVLIGPLRVLEAYPFSHLPSAQVLIRTQVNLATTPGDATGCA